MDQQQRVPGATPERRIRAIEWARREGNELVILKDAPWPDACVMCGAQQHLRRWRRSFSFLPPQAILLLFVFWPAVLFMRQSATLNIAICRDCQSRWSRSVLSSWSGALAVMIGCLAVPLALGFESMVGCAAAIAMIAGGVGTSIAAAVHGRGRVLKARSIDATTIRLGGVNPDVMNTLHEASCAQLALARGQDRPRW